MSKKDASPKDAQTLLQLYDLRRENVLRAARKFMATDFWPVDYDEFKGVMLAFGSERNAWARQCLTYWDMAAAIVLQGALHEELFYQANGELYFLYAKYGNWLPQIRKDTSNPEFLTNFEKLATRPRATQRLKLHRARIEARKAQMAAKTP